MALSCLFSNPEVLFQPLLNLNWPKMGIKTYLYTKNLFVIYFQYAGYCWVEEEETSRWCCGNKFGMVNGLCYSCAKIYAHRISFWMKYGFYQQMVYFGKQSPLTNLTILSQWKIHSFLQNSYSVTPVKLNFVHSKFGINKFQSISLLPTLKKM